MSETDSKNSLALSRRRMLRAALAGSAGVSGILASTANVLAAPGIVTGDATAPAGAFRFAHLTDPHVSDDPRATFGFAAALDSLRSLTPPPQFILSGGDHVMDTCDGDLDSARAQWKVYSQLLADHTHLPSYPLIGNHDIFGWGDPRVSPRMPEYGKQLALERLGLKRGYYSFDAGGWHFICLDSFAKRFEDYYAGLDPLQLEWLKADLAAVTDKRPICVFSHAPLLAACVFFESNVPVRFGMLIRDMQMHADTPALLEILLQHNVRLCVSGHIHMVDRVDYRGITFICNGAVCGNWWQGDLAGHAPGYGIFDVWPDGRFEHRFVQYAWKRA